MTDMLHNYLLQDFFFLFALYKTYGIFRELSWSPRAAFIRALGLLTFAAILFNLVINDHPWMAVKLVFIFIVFRMAWQKMADIREKRRARLQ